MFRHSRHFQSLPDSTAKPSRGLLPEIRQFLLSTMGGLSSIFGLLDALELAAFVATKTSRHSNRAASIDVFLFSEADEPATTYRQVANERPKKFDSDQCDRSMIAIYKKRKKREAAKYKMEAND